jgi:pimeloyl-ACP methyl ester carboxylesterase
MPPLQTGSGLTARPLRVAFPETALDDLRERLDRARWPESAGGDGWEMGPPVAYLRGLAEHWRQRFDWRRVEARINALPNFVASIDGVDIHYVHLRSRAASRLPIVLTHGWPGSFLELLGVAERLSDRFDVVVPSLPGFGFSPHPDGGGVNPVRIAELFGGLMSSLGYERFAAQGGDWGATIATRLALAFPERVAAIHLNYIPGSFAPYLGPGSRPLSAGENRFVAERDRWREEEGAYGALQSTRPRTAAYGLNDSPVGLLAWILEKLRSWSDCDGEVERRFSKDEILSHVTLYWLTGTIGSSMRLYAEARAVPLAFAEGERVRVPCSVARFPKEAPMPPRDWVERAYDVVRWTEMPRGGHFAAMEEPDLLAEDVLRIL